MFCTNCGTQLKEGSKFCPKCGKPVTPGWNEQNSQSSGHNAQYFNQTGYGQQGYSQNSYGYEQYAQGDNSQHNNSSGNYNDNLKPVRPKGSRKKIIIPVSVGAAVIVLGVGAFAMTRTNFFKSKFLSPADYYQYVEKAYIDEAAEKISAAAQRSQTMDSLVIKAQIEDAGLAIMGAAGGYDLSGAVDDLENLEYKVESGRNDDITGQIVSLYSGNDCLVSAQLITDTTAGDIYFYSPEISPDYLKLNEYDSSLGNMGNMLSIMQTPNPELLSNLFSRYAGIMLEYAGEVQRENDTVTADGVRQDAMMLTVTFDGNQLSDLFTELARNARSDKELKQYILWLSAYASASYGGYGDSDELYNSFMDQLDMFIDDIQSTPVPEDVGMSMKLWVDSQGEIIGRSLEVSDGSYKQELLRYICAENGDKYGLELVFGDNTGQNGSYIIISGGGNKEGNLADGTLNVTVDGMEACKIDISDYDTKQAENGYINGTFAITSDSDPSLQGYGLLLTLSDNTDERTLDVSVTSNDVALGTVNIVFSETDYVPELPEMSNVETSYENYVQNINQEDVINRLSQNEFLSLLIGNTYAY